MLKWIRNLVGDSAEPQGAEMPAAVPPLKTRDAPAQGPLTTGGDAPPSPISRHIILDRTAHNAVVRVPGDPDTWHFPSRRDRHFILLGGRFYYLGDLYAPVADVAPLMAIAVLQAERPIPPLEDGGVD